MAEENSSQSSRAEVYRRVQENVAQRKPVTSSERLAHMLEHLDKARAYLQGMDFEAFRDDEKTQDAVIRRIQCVAEAALHIDPSIKERHSEVNWIQLRSLGNRYRHGYDIIDAELVWSDLHAKDGIVYLTEQAIRTELPLLLQEDQ